MAREPSILKSTKKILGLNDEYDSFDLDVITHINSAFFTLYQLGIGPAGGFFIEDDTAQWSSFADEDLVNLSPVRTYLYLKVRSLLDPPGTPHHLAAMNEQIQEMEHRLKMERESLKWTAPTDDEAIGPLQGAVIVNMQGGAP